MRRPVSGSRKCAFAKNTVGKLWGLKIIVNEQIRSLASGEDCDAFIEQVRTHIHEPVADSKSARTIPIRMLMATNDKMVDFDDTHTPSALYARVAAQQLDATHSDIKLPDSHLNTRYRVLTMDIQNGLAERFQQICQAYLTGDAEEKRNAKIDFFKRYESLLECHFKESTETDYHQFLRLVVNDGAKSRHPPFEVANRALIEMRAAQFDL